MPDSDLEAEPVLIFAAEALEHAARSCGDRISAKQRLADLLKDGRISARAERQWLSKKPSLTDAWRSRSKAKFDTDVAVTRLAWGRSRFWSDDLDMWRWSRNRFVLTAGPAERLILEGVRLNQRDVELEFPLATPSEAAPSTRRVGAGGRPPKRDEWHEFWLAVLKRSQNGELSTGFFRTQDALLEALHADITKANGTYLLSEATIKPQVRRIWAEYVAPLDDTM